MLLGFHGQEAVLRDTGARRSHPPLISQVSSLAAEREELKAHVRHLEGSLFSEQRTARARIEELQEVGELPGAPGCF